MWKPNGKLTVQVFQNLREPIIVSVCEPKISPFILQPIIHAREHRQICNPQLFHRDMCSFIIKITAKAAFMQTQSQSVSRTSVDIRQYPETKQLDIFAFY